MNRDRLLARGFSIAVPMSAAIPDFIRLWSYVRKADE
jgi:hypothetical protein